MKKMKVVNRTRFLIFITMTVAILLTSLGLLLNTANAYSSTNKHYTVICVEKGDTLWEIAKKSNFKNNDIRKSVHKIMKANKLNDGKIYPGDSLIIPLE